MWNSKDLRRLGSGAVLACGVLWSACGGNDGLSAPETPPAEPPPDVGVEPSAGCNDGVLEHGALYRICFPAAWNGDLVVYAHGYVAPNRELALPDDEISGQPASSLVTGLGYAFATTSYRANGLVAPDAVNDLVELVDTVQSRFRPDPVRTALVGFSEGGLVATLGVERHPDRFDGALVGCGPVGDFGAQLDYIGDFRVVFDYLFPGLLPGSAVDVPDSLRDRWDELYVPAIVVALAAKPDAARELIAITKAPVAGTDVRSIAETVIGLLWYNVFGTADAQERLGGQPFDNANRVYSGSSDDAALNAGVARFSPDPTVEAALATFQTAGDLDVPVVMLHTTGDPIVPFTQSSLYAAKVSAAGASALLTVLPVERHGHCTFEASEVLGAFTTLWNKIPDHAAAMATAGYFGRPFVPLVPSR
jgi:pimeloyl-ACP methyl ester carboxylesterase